MIGMGGRVRMRFPTVLVMLAVIGVSVPELRAQTAPDKFLWNEIADGIYMVSPNGLGSNSVVVMGADGVLIVDAQQGTASMDLLLDQLAERTDAPVTHVVLTHWHLDHSGGRAAIQRRFPESVVLAHSQAAGQARTDLLDQAARILAFWSDPDRELLDVDRRVIDELAEPAPFVPRRTLSSDTTLFAGGREVRVLARGAAHTAGDLAVYFPGVDILAAGDLVLPQIFSNAGSPSGHLASLQAFADLAPAVIVGGHGAPFINSDLPARQARQLSAWMSEVEALLEDEQPTSSAEREALVPRAAALAGDLIGDPQGVARVLLRVER